MKVYGQKIEIAETVWTRLFPLSGPGPRLLDFDDVDRFGWTSQRCTGSACILLWNTLLKPLHLHLDLDCRRVPLEQEVVRLIPYNRNRCPSCRFDCGQDVRFKYGFRDNSSDAPLREIRGARNRRQNQFRRR